MTEKQLEKIYGFSFEEEFLKKKREILEDVEGSNEWGKSCNKKWTKSLREVFSKIVRENTYLQGLFNDTLIDFPHFYEESNRLEVVENIENFIDKLLYCMIDDGELYFVKVIITDKDGKKEYKHNRYVFSDDIPSEKKIKDICQCVCIEKIEIESRYVSSVYGFCMILNELFNKNNYSSDDYFLDDEKAFEKYFQPCIRNSFQEGITDYYVENVLKIDIPQNLKME